MSELEQVREALKKIENAVYEDRTAQERHIGDICAEALAALDNLPVLQEGEVAVDGVRLKKELRRLVMSDLKSEPIEHPAFPWITIASRSQCINVEDKVAERLAYLRREGE